MHISSISSGCVQCCTWCPCLVLSKPVEFLNTVACYKLVIRSWAVECVMNSLEFILRRAETRPQMYSNAPYSVLLVPWNWCGIPTSSCSAILATLRPGSVAQPIGVPCSHTTLLGLVGLYEDHFLNTFILSRAQ